MDKTFVVDSPVKIYRTVNGFLAVKLRPADEWTAAEESMCFEKFETMVEWLSIHFTKPIVIGADS